jgi:hypothetical protein
MGIRDPVFYRHEWVVCVHVAGMAGSVGTTCSQGGEFTAGGGRASEPGFLDEKYLRHLEESRFLHTTLAKNLGVIIGHRH